MLKKISIVTCPTELTKDYLISKNIADVDKIFVLKDPIISLKEIKKINLKNYQKYKNHIFLQLVVNQSKNFSF